MLENFDRDLAIGHRGEEIVKNTFSALTDKYEFKDISNNPLYYHSGDILAIDSEGKEIFIEVKNDSCIAKTKNVLCEEEVYYYRHDTYVKGNMYSNYQYYCVVSEEERKIYVIDFSLLKKNYKKGQLKKINHPQQYSICYLCELYLLKKWGALIAEVDY